jgi:Cutinase/Regulator of chromosome condensation (RCC1) repeat
VSSHHVRAGVRQGKRLGLRRVAALVPLLVVGVMFSSGSGPAHASAAGTPTGCQSVFFFGAVGSGEWADNKANNGQESSTWFGNRVWWVLKDLGNDLPGRGIASSSLMYPAVSAIPGTLGPSKPEIAAALGLGLGAAWAVNDYLNTKLTPFKASISMGVDTATGVLENRAVRCPSERIVLAGYSQGAMVMHEVVNRLYDTGQNAILARIGGVVLLADGDRVPFTQTSLMGSPVAGRAGKGITSWQPGKAREIAPPVIGRTFSICVKNDVVCDFRGAWDLPNFNTAGNIHIGPGYEANSWPVQVATSKVASLLQEWAAPTPPAQNAYPTVGQPFRLQLAADARTGSVLRWRQTSALPSGLSMSPTGRISGTPTAAGTWTVGYQVQAQPTGPSSDWIPGSLTLHVSTTVGGGQTQAGKIAAGTNSSCAVTTAGAVKCWGWNGHGELGNGTTIDSLTPVDVVGLGSGVASVSAGYNGTCAVTTAGAVKCWGWNVGGELGNGTTTQSTTPVDVVGLGSGVASVSPGLYHTCALTTAGAVKCWGYNGDGELGNGTTTIGSNTPVDVVGLGSGVASVSAGNGHTCTVTTAGAVKCWGYNVGGVLGNGTTIDSNTPVDVVGLGSGVASVSAGFDHTCAVTTASAVKCWGWNGNGELGNGTTTNATTPVDVVGLGSGVASVSAGDYHTCAVTTDVVVKCWGLNTNGQLGNGTTTNAITPVGVIGLP